MANIYSYKFLRTSSIYAFVCASSFLFLSVDSRSSQKKCLKPNNVSVAAVADNKEFPEIHVNNLVSLYTSKNMDGKNWTEVENSKIIVPSTVEFVQLECKARYRVQWGFQSYPWITFDTWTTVYRPKYKNESVIYSSTIEFHKVQETSLQTRIPICYSIDDPCVQTAVVPKSAPPNSVEMILETASSYGIESQSEKEIFGTNLNCTLKFGYDVTSQKFYCQETDSKTKTPGKIFLRPCQDPVTCASLVADSDCVAEPIFPISECTIENRCRKETAFAGQFPGIAVCHSGKLPLAEHSAVIPYFSSLSVSSYTNKTMRYLDWDRADPTEMLQFPSLSEPIYTHQKITLVCNASYFYLGSGMFFELVRIAAPARKPVVEKLSSQEEDNENDNDTDSSENTTVNNGNESMNGNETSPDDLKLEQNELSLAKESIKSEEANTGGIVDSKLPLIRSLEANNLIFSTEGKFKLSCYAPVWNSTKWAVKSINVTVKESISPEFDGGNMTAKQYYAPYKRLECLAYGVPKPELSWTRDGAPVPEEINLITGEQNQTFVWATLVFPKVDYGISGNFTCTATNVAGTMQKTFLIILPDKTSSIAISILVGFAILISVMIPLILLLCWKVKRQRRLLDGLTQEEIDEFVNGRPEFIPFQSDMSTYAYYLPYDKSYEIPRESLEIDYEKILGSGEYGLVLHGLYKNANGEGMPTIKPVAVKTTKPLTSGKEHFKALLSELKIMTYIKNHDNIVNLVGAVTNDIAKREVYIALEYCENGSLLAYLRTNRYAIENPSFYTEIANPNHRISATVGETSFINPIFANIMKDGRMMEGVPDIQYVKMEDLGNMVINPQYENIRAIKQHNLVLWSYDIACGMEFLASKKVIHGDLAARNVLLTRDLTAKICDFGLSRQLYHYTYYTKTAVTPLPLKWLAIECLQNFQFSIESDIWAYGVTLFEIFSIGEIPYASLQMNGEEFLRALKHGLRLSKPTYAPMDIFDLMMKCWRYDKKQRPRFSDIAKFMKHRVDKTLTQRRESIRNAIKEHSSTSGFHIDPVSSGRNILPTSAPHPQNTPMTNLFNTGETIDTIQLSKATCGNEGELTPSSESVLQNNSLPRYANLMPSIHE